MKAHVILRKIYLIKILIDDPILECLNSELNNILDHSQLEELY